MKMQEINIDFIKEYENNPRKNDVAIEKVAKSIKEFGFKVPIIIDKNNIIVTGHTRLKAAKQLKMKKVPCIIADDLTPEQVKAFRLADNKVSEYSTWDLDKLQSELIELKVIDFNIEDFGFETKNIDTSTANVNEILEKFTDTTTEIKEDDFNIEEAIPEIPITTLGQVWQLGSHRLMCGDSTSLDDVEKLMNGNKADMVFTDPPYLMEFTGNVHADGSKSHNAKFGAIKNDKMTRKDGDEFILAIFMNIQKFNKGAYYVCFYRLGLDYIFRALDKLNNQYKALIIWNKGNHTLSNSDYMSKYEPIVYGWFNNHIFYGDRSNFDIWDIQRTQKNDLHPTMKPIELMVKAISNSSKANNIVLDLFGGSGSTLIACEQLNRQCYMMELDLKYCDVIIKRWETLTGKKAVLID